MVGYIIIAVLTGIFVAECVAGMLEPRRRIACPACRLQDHETDAHYCRHCGAALEHGTD